MEQTAESMTLKSWLLAVLVWLVYVIPFGGGLLLMGLELLGIHAARAVLNPLFSHVRPGILEVIVWSWIAVAFLWPLFVFPVTSVIGYLRSEEWRHKSALAKVVTVLKVALVVAGALAFLLLFTSNAGQFNS